MSFKELIEVILLLVAGLLLIGLGIDNNDSIIVFIGFLVFVGTIERGKTDLNK